MVKSVKWAAAMCRAVNGIHLDRSSQLVDFTHWRFLLLAVSGLGRLIVCIRGAVVLIACHHNLHPFREFVLIGRNGDRVVALTVEPVGLVLGLVLVLIVAPALIVRMMVRRERILRILLFG